MANTELAEIINDFYFDEFDVFDESGSIEEEIFDDIEDALPPVFSQRYVSRLYGRIHDEIPLKKWQIWSQGYYCLSFNVG